MTAISVIVPTRNRTRLLIRALRSLQAQTLRDFEVLVVDDNDPDQRIAGDPTINEILRDQRFRVLIHDTPRNAASARNFGLRNAQGEWITYLDDDDAYRPGKLQQQYDRARQSGLPMGFCGLMFQLNGRQRCQHLDRQEFAGTELLLDVQTVIAIFHRRAEGIFFDENLGAGEDAHFFQQLVRHFGVRRAFNVPEVLMDIYPQTGLRVNTHPEKAWAAMELIHREFAASYGEKAAAVFYARARLGRGKLVPGGWLEMLRVSARLLRLRGLPEGRVVANALLYKIPLFRRFLVG